MSKSNRADYIPRRNSHKSTWANTLKDNIPAVGAVVGESAADITAVQNAAQGVIDEVRNIDAAKVAYKSAMISAKNNMKKHLGVIRRHARRIKTSSGYSIGAGLSLGIVATGHLVNVNNSIPRLKISKVASGYRITYNLHGFFHGVHIYRKRPADERFHLLATDSNPPYIDTNPMVDGTLYYAIFMLHDEEVGQISAKYEVKL